MDILDSKDVIGVKASEQEPPTHYAGHKLPSLIARVKALVIDGLIILVVFTAMTLLIDGLGEVPDFVRGFVLVFMLFLYDPLLTAFTGSTVGHKVMKLTVRKFASPEERISLGPAILRFLVKGLLGWISFLTVTSNERRRAMHDLASGSIILVDK